MSFTDAIPLNRVANARHAGFDQKSRGEGGRAEVGDRQRAKQMVNISEDTLIRLAKSKLSRVVRQKLAYDQRGAFRLEQPVGAFLSTKA